MTTIRHMNTGYSIHPDTGELVRTASGKSMKQFKIKYNIGSVKYSVSFHDGEKKHKDGSEFFDLRIFKNKRDLAKFVSSLKSNGYQEA